MKNAKAIKFPEGDSFENQMRHAFLIALARQPEKSKVTRLAYRALCSPAGITTLNKFRSI